jgi:hypothetical protein
MSVNQPAKKEIDESTSGWQHYLFWFVAVVVVALIILPLLPGFIANLEYSFHSFGGKAPKIYWYLSRASGFISFTLLWISMALGLGITNKMARLWPGAPSAFAVHQYTSMLGLAFAAYHGLVLIGDHFTDFSLPKLLTPFSIAYETTWVGLGQVSFYIWLIVVLSFYVRQQIGQKTWRMIHYANFGIFVMGFLHGIRTGTDAQSSWVVGYFWISGISLLMLLAYRIYETSLKGKAKLVIPNLTLPNFRQVAVPETIPATTQTLTRPSLATRMKNLPMALLRSQAKSPLALPQQEQIIEPVTIQPSVEAKVETQAEAPVEAPIQLATNDMVAALTVAEGGEVVEQQPSTQAPLDLPVTANEIQAPPPEETKETKATSPSQVVRLIGTLENGKKIRIRLFGEPAKKQLPEPDLELEDCEEAERQEKTLLVRLKDRFRRMPVEPTRPRPELERIGFSED